MARAERAHRGVGIAIAAVVLAALLVPTGAGAFSNRFDRGILTSASPRAIVMFEGPVGEATIGRLAAAGITHAKVLEDIDGVIVQGPIDAYVAIAGWPDVLRVDDDDPITFHNETSKKDTRVYPVRKGRKPLRTGYTGKGVSVAVVDSGIDSTHPDLDDNIAVNVNMEPAWFMDDISEGDYSENNAEQPIGTDEFGHGTHVAGTIAGTGESGRNADLSGVAPKATIINLKIGITPSNRSAFEADALASYDWILDHRSDERFPPIKVASNSWGLGGELTGDQPLEKMIRRVVQAGITVVFSAGNSGPEENTVSQYPNAMEEVITIGALCKSDAPPGGYCPQPSVIASFSSRGPEVDVVAPGVSIWSTKANYSALGLIGAASATNAPGQPDPTAMANNNAFYTSMSGTSMSAPHVSGIVALMLDANPRLVPQQVEGILTATARDAGPPGFDTAYGFGVVDAFRAVKRAER